jgi:hypothetical protein
MALIVTVTSNNEETIMEPKTPAYTWRINLDRSLQHQTAVVATKQNREIREYVSSLLREKLQKEEGEN